MIGLRWTRRVPPSQDSLNFRCSHSKCSSNMFSDRGSLLRHQREVHRVSNGFKPPSSHYCPIPNCKRNTRGFARPWNLQEHRRRMHGDQPDKSNFSLSTPLSSPAEESSWIPDTQEAQAKTDEHLDASYVTAEPARLRGTIEALTREPSWISRRLSSVKRKRPWRMR